MPELAEHDHDHDLNQASSASVLHDREHCLMLVDGNPSGQDLRYVAIHAHGDPALCYAMYVTQQSDYVIVQFPDGGSIRLPLPPKSE